VSEFFATNLHKLDEEWVNQSSLYYTYAEKLADAQLEYDRAMTDLDIVTAELDKSIRKEPTSFGIDKNTRLTENMVERTIFLQSRWQLANDSMLTAKHNYNKAQSVVRALDHKKKALEKLVDLFLANYYSEPRQPREPSDSQDWQEREKQLIRRKGQQQLNSHIKEEVPSGP